MARSHGLNVLARSPLAAGVLTGKYVLDGDKIHIDATLRGAEHNSERLISPPTAFSVPAPSHESRRPKHIGGSTSD